MSQVGQGREGMDGRLRPCYSCVGLLDFRLLSLLYRSPSPDLTPDWWDVFKSVHLHPVPLRFIYVPLSLSPVLLSCPFPQDFRPTQIFLNLP